MDAARREQWERIERIGTRVGVGLVIFGFVAMLATMFLGAAEVYPYEYTVAASLVAFCAPVGLAILLGATVGFYLVGGWPLVPIGVLFTVAFAGLVLGVVLPDTLMRDLSIAAFGLCGGAVYFAGIAGDVTPPSARQLWARPGSIILGVVVTVIGYGTNNWMFLLFGAMAAGCGIGGVLGTLVSRRRRGTAARAGRRGRL
jgi:hypothetical protein